MNLADITPLVLTCNEAPNIGRCLERLRWAQEVVVVDSHSDDQTVPTAQTYPNVRVVARAFDQHAAQWNFGLRETGISTPWVLALDADYLVEPALRAELASLAADERVAAFRARFIYRVLGRELRGSVYPPVCVLFRRDRCEFVQDGHTHRLAVREGTIGDLVQPIIHDDRKPLARWLASQSRYMELEAQKLLAAAPGELTLADRLRKSIVLAPPAMLAYCLLAKGGLLDGWPGWYYALQRTTAEAILSLKLIERKIGRAAGDPGEGAP